jgi:multimeric flavodoxin WrbA
MLILNGGPRDGRGASCRKIAETVAGESRAKGWNVTAYDLDGLNIKPCRGCFACWLKHPGTCAIKDDEELILKAMAGSDAQVWITPVTFGGFSPALKKALDRSIPNILPFFVKVHGEVHHPQRYKNRRIFVAFGTLASPDAEAERIFHNLLQRNALNLGSVITESRVLYEGAEGAGVAGLVEGLLQATAEAR